MNRPTNRIQELQQHQLLGFFARWGLRAAALGALGGAWEVRPVVGATRLRSPRCIPHVLQPRLIPSPVSRPAPGHQGPAQPSRPGGSFAFPATLSPAKEHPVEPCDLTLTEHRPNTPPPTSPGAPSGPIRRSRRSAPRPPNTSATSMKRPMASASSSSADPPVAPPGPRPPRSGGRGPDRPTGHPP